MSLEVLQNFFNLFNLLIHIIPSLRDQASLVQVIKLTYHRLKQNYYVKVNFQQKPSLPGKEKKDNKH